MRGILRDDSPRNGLAVPDIRDIFPSGIRGRNDAWNNIMTDASEELRLRYLYRKLILDGKIALSFESAKKIIGPNCAYHLYSVPAFKKKMKKRKCLS